MNVARNQEIEQIHARSKRLQKWVFLACVLVVTLVAIVFAPDTDGGMVVIMFGPPAGGAVGYVITTIIANRTNDTIAKLKRKPAR